MDSFKYLGTILDKSVTLNDHVEFTFKKAQQRLFLLRQLRSFHILTRVYQSLVGSVLVFNIVSWFGHFTVKNKAKLSRVVKQGSKITGQSQTLLSQHHNKAVDRLSLKIIDDSNHPLSHYIELLPSGQRYRLPCAKKNVYRNFFVPSAIRELIKP